MCATSNTDRIILGLFPYFERVLIELVTFRVLDGLIKPRRTLKGRVNELLADEITAIINLRGSGFGEHWHIVGDGHQSGIVDSVSLGHAVPARMAGTPEDPDDGEPPSQWAGKNLALFTYSLRVLGDHEDEREVVHPEGGVKKFVRVD